MSLPPSPAPSQTPPAATADPRLIEGWALTETARRLAAAAEQPADAGTLLEAVRLNWRLWSIFQASLFDPECPLPADLRDNILALAAFIDRHSADLIADPDPGKVGILVSINRELAGGLTTAAVSVEPR